MSRSEPGGVGRRVSATPSQLLNASRVSGTVQDKGGVGWGRIQEKLSSNAGSLFSCDHDPEQVA